MDYPKMIKNHTKIVLTRKKDGEKITILDTTPENRVVGKVPAGIPITECVDDTLDTSVFIIKAYQRELFEEFDIVELTIGNALPKQMVVANDVSELYQRDVEPQTYQHTVTLVEPTKILEKFKVYSLNLTNPQDTLLRQAEKAINNAIPRIITMSAPVPISFTLSSDLIELLETKPSEDFYFSNTDLRAVMDGILLSNNCRSAVNKITFDNNGDIKSIEIGYRSLSAVKEVSPIWIKDKHGKIVNEVLKNNAQDYAGKLYAKGVNSICNNPITFTDMFKSGEATVNSSNAKITFPFPISEKGIKSFVFKVKYYVGGSMDSDITGDVDIASHFIESSKYQLLSEGDKKNYLPYDIGSQELDVALTYKGFVLIHSILENIVMISLQKQTVAGTGVSKVVIDLNNPFTCTYYPQITTYSEVTKPGVYEKDRLSMGIWSNQTENNLDINRHGKQLLSLIRRTGNGEQYIDVEVDDYHTLLPLMSKIVDTGYVVYKREIAVYDMFCKCRYYLSQHYNAINSKAGVNRVKHLYDIPLESDECPLIVKRYLAFSRFSLMGTDKCFSKEVILNALKTATGQSKTDSRLKYMLFRTYAVNTTNEVEVFPHDTEDSSENKPYTDANYRFMLPCVCYGQGKSMNFIAKPLDNYSVNYSRDGYRLSLWGDGGNRMTYCRYVSKHKNIVGECHEFQLEYATSCDILDSPEYHTSSSLNEIYRNFIQLLPVSDQSRYSLATNQKITIYYDKDRTQTPVFITSFECIPASDSYGDIIIGTAFCRENNLVMDNSSATPTRRVVVLSEKLNDTDDSVAGKSYTDIGSASDYFSVGTINGTPLLELTKDYDGSAGNISIKAWAIINEKQEILIACNGLLCTVHAGMVAKPV